MILRELKKALKTAHRKMSYKKSTAAERAEWKRRYKALLKIVEYINTADWADEDEREKVIFILSKGYKAAGEQYGVSRQALSRSFSKANSAIEDCVPDLDLTIRLIMDGMVSTGIIYMESEKLANEAGLMMFPNGVLELLPKPAEGSEDDYTELVLLSPNSQEFCFLQSLTVNDICKRMMKCNMSKLAKLLGFFSATEDSEKDRQLELAELLMEDR